MFVRLVLKQPEKEEPVDSSFSSRATLLVKPDDLLVQAIDFGGLFASRDAAENREVEVNVALHVQH